MPKKPDETKDFKFSVESVDPEAGKFSGYASTFGEMDLVGDIVVRGAFKKTLSERERFPLNWAHDTTHPLGIVRAEEDRKGLKFVGELCMDVQSAREKRSLMKQGAVTGVSIGYDVVRAEADKDTGARLLKEIKLYEISLCEFPACQSAQVLDVKNVDGNEPTDTSEVDPAETKPYPNEHACRLQDPGNFEKIRSGTRKHNGKEYRVLYGQPKGGGGWEEQAYRYPTDSWTADEARAHCKDHDGSFEAASGKCVECSAPLDEPGQPTQLEGPQDKAEPVNDHSLKTYAEVIREFRESLERGQNA